MTGREIHWKTAGHDVILRIEESKGQGSVHVEGRTVPFTVRDRNADSGWIEVHGKNHRYYLHRDGDEFTVWIDGRTYRIERIEKGRLLEQAAASNASGDVRSLMPGKVIRVEVKEGDRVSERQPVVIMESMKMETSLVSPRDGIVTRVRCEPGQAVDMGELLVVVGDGSK